MLRAYYWFITQELSPSRTQGILWVQGQLCAKQTSYLLYKVSGPLLSLRFNF